MGSAQSYISPETAVTALVIAGTIGLGYTQFGTATTSTAAVSAEEGQDTTSKKGKKKKKAKTTGPSGDISETLSVSKSQSQTPQPPSSRVVEFPEVIPGQFEISAGAAPDSDPSTKDPSATSPKSKKGKKKSKGKAAGAAEAEVPQTVSASIDYLSEADLKESAPSTKNAKRQRTPTQQPAVPVIAASSSQLKRPSHQSTTSIDTDGSWTRVGLHKRGRTATDADSSALSAEADPATSDAGLTPSVTGESSPAVERRASTSTEDESFLLNVSTRDSGEHRRTLAEKLLPKPRKTAVDELRLFYFFHDNGFGQLTICNSKIFFIVSITSLHITSLSYHKYA